VRFAAALAGAGAALVFLLPAGCVVTRPGADAGPETAAQAERLSPEQISASVLAAMDRTADPCRDFYQYACGGWLRETKLPPDRPRLGRGFAAIEDRNRIVLRDILDDALRHRGADPDTGRLGDFYGACMDETAIERLGVERLGAVFSDIASVTNPATLMTAVGHLQLSGVDVLFAPAVDADFKDPNLAIAHWFQGGLGLPDRDHYLKDDEKSRTLRTQYEAHVARMLVLGGAPEEEARRQAAAILGFEKRLAEASLSRAERRDPEKIYHRVDRGGLQVASPALPWDAYFTAIGFPSLQAINVGMPEFFSALSSAVTTTPIETLQAYLRWHTVDSMADSLPRPFAEEHFAFFGKILGGQEEIEPRWKRCVDATDEAMGELLGKAFVTRRFAGDSKTTALRMIDGIEKALAHGFPALAWMDEATRARAQEKLAAVTNKIGYPDVWRDYSALRLQRGDDFGNRMEAARFEFRRQFAKVGAPVDRGEWEMTPPTVNAYYKALRNEMVFPAGILQPPFFHRDFPRAVNYGAMGMAMGHELTHGFDDQGRKFDPQGQLREWWDPAAAGRFQERAACVESLYDGYEVEPGLHLNGAQTLGENIADLGGLKEAYRAYKDWEAEQSAVPPSPVPGLSNDQLFFVGFAQTWCELVTPEYSRLLVSIDYHSPGRYRVRGPVSQSPEFARAFACGEGTPMNPAKKCEVW
jgi:endothelin-converting enzyme/putative endopeptidase